MRDAISAASLTAAETAEAPGTLAATVSDNTTYSIQGDYPYGSVKIYSGHEHILYANPSHPLTAGVADIGGYRLSFVNNTAYNIHPILEISWTGLRYSVTPAFDLTGAYYRYDQRSYNGNGCSDASASSCGGSMNAVSFVADYRFMKRFDLYGGITYSTVAGGLAAGYLKTSVIAPMVGGRLTF